MVTAPSQLKEETTLRCGCGSDLGRDYSAPTVRKLEAGEAELLQARGCLKNFARGGRNSKRSCRYVPRVDFLCIKKQIPHRPKAAGFEMTRVDV